MPGSTFTPGQAWLKTVRSGLREWVKRNGQIPALMCAVSADPGTSPRKAKFSMRLDMLEDSLAVRALVQEQVRSHGSRYAAFGGLSTDRLSFVLVVVTEHRGETWTATVDARRGLGGWDRGGDVPAGWGWVQKVIEEARDAE